MHFGFSFGYHQASGSTALANILYNMDTFNVDVSNLRTIDNAGSDGATADGLMYGSNHISLGATQSVDYVTVNTGDYCYFDVTTKAHVKATATGATTTISTPTHHSNFFSLKAGKSISAGDLTSLNANPEDIARMVKGVATVGTYSFTLADIEAFYPGNEGEGSLQYVQNVNSPLGTEKVPNAEFTTDITGWSSSNTAVATVSWVSTGKLRVDYIAAGSATILSSIFSSDATHPKLIHGKIDTNSANLSISMSVSNVGAKSGTIGDIFFFSPNSWNNQKFQFAATGAIGDYYIIDFASVKDMPSATITNYTASSRTTYKNTNYGASNFLYTQDATGRLTGMHTSGHIKSGTDGRNITIAMTAPYNHVVTKDIDKIEGTLLSSTITYSDTTTLVVP